MGRKLHYKPGSFYRTDDRTGFVQRAGRTREQWDGLIVDTSVWEPRQPQDLVKGVKDEQWVPQARPLGPNVYVGPIAVTLTETAPPQSYTIEVNTTGRLQIGDIVGVVLDDGTIWRTPIALLNATLIEFITDAGAALTFLTNSGFPLRFYNSLGGSIVLSTPIPRSAPSGNLLIDYNG